MKFRRVLLCLVWLGLSACHDSNNTADSAPNPPPATDPPPAATGTVKVTLTLPLAGSSAPEAAATGTTAKHETRHAQKTSYVSSKTQSVTVTLLTVNGASPATPVGASIDVKDGSACVITGGNLNCTLSLAAPVGSDAFQVDTWPSTGGGGSLALSSGAGTVNVTQNSNVDLAVELLPRIKTYDVEIAPGARVAPIGSPGVFTARIRGKDAAGDIITGTTNYHDPMVVTSNEIAGHITASPTLPVTFTSPAQDTITFTYDGGGTASSYAFNIAGSTSQNYYLTFSTSQEHVYVSLPAANEIDVYDIEADGSLTGPSRSIVGPNTGLNHPTSISIDTLGQLFVANSNNLLIFAPGADGDVAPLHTTYVGAHPYYVSYLAGMILNYAVVNGNTPDTSTSTVNINYPSGILFSTDSGLPPNDILSFVDPAAGAVASWSVPTGSGYLCETYVDPVDYNQDRVRCFTMPISTLTQPGGALGSDYPNIQIINGNANNTLSCCFVHTYDLKFLSDGRLLVSSGTGYNKAAALETYVLPSGNVIASLHGSDTLLEVPIAIAFDSQGNDYVLDAGLATGDGKVLEFAPGATGNVRPIHQLGGFTFPGGMTIGP